MHKTKHPRRAWFIALHRYYVSTYLTMISTLFLTVFSLSFSQVALASATAVSLAKDSSDSLSFCQMSLKWASCRLSITCSVWHPRCVIWNGQNVKWKFTATISINNVGNQKGIIEPHKCLNMQSNAWYLTRTQIQKLFLTLWSKCRGVKTPVPSIPSNQN